MGPESSTPNLSLSLRLVELIKKAVVITRPVRDKHLGEGVALTIGFDAQIASQSINVLNQSSSDTVQQGGYGLQTSLTER